MTKYAKAETEYVVLSRILSEVLSAGDKVRSDDTAYGKLWVSLYMSNRNLLSYFYHYLATETNFI